MKKRIPKRYRKIAQVKNELIGMDFEYLGKRWIVDAVRSGRVHIKSRSDERPLHAVVDLRMLPKLLNPMTLLETSNET